VIAFVRQPHRAQRCSRVYPQNGVSARRHHRQSRAGCRLCGTV